MNKLLLFIFFVFVGFNLSAQNIESVFSQIKLFVEKRNDIAIDHSKFDDNNIKNILFYLKDKYLSSTNYYHRQRVVLFINRYLLGNEPQINVLCLELILQLTDIYTYPLLSIPFNDYFQQRGVVDHLIQMLYNHNLINMEKAFIATKLHINDSAKVIYNDKIIKQVKSAYYSQIENPQIFYLLVKLKVYSVKNQLEKLIMKKNPLLFFYDITDNNFNDENEIEHQFNTLWALRTLWITISYNRLFNPQANEFVKTNIFDFAFYTCNQNVVKNYIRDYLNTVDNNSDLRCFIEKIQTMIDNYIPNNKKKSKKLFLSWLNNNTLKFKDLYYQYFDNYTGI